VTNENELRSTVPMIIYVNNQSLTVDALVDTGALQANYIDNATAAWIATCLEYAALDARNASVGCDLSCTCNIPGTCNLKMSNDNLNTNLEIAEQQLKLTGERIKFAGQTKNVNHLTSHLLRKNQNSTRRCLRTHSQKKRKQKQKLSLTNPKSVLA
jgi:hypothetical protein